MLDNISIKTREFQLVMDIGDKNNQHHQTIEVHRSGVNVTKQKCDEYQSGP